MICVCETPPLSYSYCALLQTEQPRAFLGQSFPLTVLRTVSLLREALFSIIAAPVIPARMYVFPPGLRLSSRFDAGINHVWATGSKAGPSRRPVYPECQRADVALRENRRGGPPTIPPRLSPPLCLSVCLSGHVARSDGNKAARRVQRCKSPRPSRKSRAVQTGSTPACVLSCQVADILI